MSLEDLLKNPVLRNLLGRPDVQQVVRDAAAKTMNDEQGDESLFYSWRPRPKLEYQRNVMRCDCRTIALTLGNQCGKTLTGARFVTARMKGFDPLYPDRVYKVPQKWWGLTKGPLMEGLLDEMLTMVPPDDIMPRSIKRSAGRFKFRLKNRSSFEMRSFDQSVDAMKQAKVDGVWIDELPSNGEKHWIELHVRLLRRGGTMLLTGTPDKFGHAWLKRKLVNLGWGQPQYKNALSGEFSWSEADVRDNDVLDPDSIDKLIREIGNDEEMFQIKICGKWPDTEGSNIFPAWAINEQRMNVCVPALWYGFDDFGIPYERAPYQGWSIYEERIPGYGYAMGVDVSMGGERSDFSSVHIFKVISNQVVATWHGRIDPDVLARECLAAAAYYNLATIASETNGKQGGAFISIIKKSNYPNVYIREAHGWKREVLLKDIGWETTTHNKPRIVFETKQLLVSRKLYIPCQKTLDEMMSFQDLRESDPENMGFGAVEGNDDRVMSLMIGLQACKQAQANLSASPEDIFKYKDPKVGLAVSMVRGHLKDQKRPRSQEEWD